MKYNKTSSFAQRRSGRVVEGGGLENRCTLTGTVGSNPTSSANSFSQLADSETDSVWQSDRNFLAAICMY